MTTAKNINPAPVESKLKVVLVYNGSVVSSAVIKMASTIAAHKAQRSRGYWRIIMNGGKCAVILERFPLVDEGITVASKFSVAEGHQCALLRDL